MRRAAKELYLNIKLQLNCPALQTTVSPKWLMCIRILKTYVLVSSSFVLVSVYPTFFCLRTRRKWNLPEEYFTSTVNSSYRILLSITQSSNLKLPTKNDIINYTAVAFCFRLDYISPDYIFRVIQWSPYMCLIAKTEIIIAFLFLLISEFLDEKFCVKYFSVKYLPEIFHKVFIFWKDVSCSVVYCQFSVSIRLKLM